MAYGKDELIDALRIRYDHASADVVFELARQRAQLEAKAQFSEDELRAFRAALASVGDRVGNVLAAIDQMTGLPAAAAAKAEPPSAAKEPEKPAAEKPAAEKPAAEKPAAEKKQTDKKASEKKEPDKKAADKSDAAETMVVLTGVEAKEDEEVLMCGAFAELGDWDPERARPMSRKGDQWLATVKLPADAKVAFKFLRRTSDGNVTWEDGDDRELVAKQRLEATWR